MEYVTLQRPFETLGDQQLLDQTQRLAANKRAVEVHIVDHLAEIDRRELALRRGFSSLFDYAVRELGIQRCVGAAAHPDDAVGPAPRVGAGGPAQRQVEPDFGGAVGNRLRRHGAREPATEAARRGATTRLELPAAAQPAAGGPRGGGSRPSLGCASDGSGVTTSTGAGCTECLRGRRGRARHSRVHAPGTAGCRRNAQSDCRRLEFSRTGEKHRGSRVGYGWRYEPRGGRGRTRVSRDSIRQYRAPSGSRRRPGGVRSGSDINDRCDHRAPAGRG